MSDRQPEYTNRAVAFPVASSSFHDQARLAAVRPRRPRWEAETPATEDTLDFSQLPPMPHDRLPLNLYFQEIGVFIKLKWVAAMMGLCGGVWITVKVFASELSNGPQALLLSLFLVVVVVLIGIFILQALVRPVRRATRLVKEASDFTPNLPIILKQMMDLLRLNTQLSLANREEQHRQQQEHYALGQELLRQAQAADATLMDLALRVSAYEDPELSAVMQQLAQNLEAIRQQGQRVMMPFDAPGSAALLSGYQPDEIERQLLAAGTTIIDIVSQVTPRINQAAIDLQGSQAGAVPRMIADEIDGGFDGPEATNR